MNDYEFPAPPPAPAHWLAAPGPRESAVEVNLAALEKAMAELDNRVDALTARIAPALTPQPPMPPTPCGGSAPRPLASPLADSLRAKAEIVEALGKRIAAVTARVEL